MPEDVPATLHIAEGGFRPRPELLAAYAERHAQFMPHARAQGGFREDLWWADCGHSVVALLCQI